MHAITSYHSAPLFRGPATHMVFIQKLNCQNEKYIKIQFCKSERACLFLGLFLGLEIQITRTLSIDKPFYFRTTEFVLNTLLVLCGKLEFLQQPQEQLYPDLPECVMLLLVLLL